jgi:hypothetical protein
MITSNGVKTDDPKMMTDELAKQFSRASGSTQYKDDFKKEQEEGKPLHVDYKNEEPYNSPQTKEELDEALAGCAGPSPDPDHIHYEFIKKMARTEKLKLRSRSIRTNLENRCLPQRVDGNPAKTRNNQKTIDQYYRQAACVKSWKKW